MFSKDHDEVADLFQEALVNLWKGFERNDKYDNLRGWIYRVTLNTCISLDRKKRSRAEVALSTGIDLFDPDNENAKQADMLHSRISRLQPFDRAIVLLWLEDISYDEIGSILGISTSNVAVRLYRIKEQLKQMSNN